MADEKRDHPETAYLGPASPDGGRVCVHHVKGDEYRAGVVYPLQDGRPVSPDSELVQLTEREGAAAGVYNFKSLGKVSEHAGPAMVSNDAYRDGWDKIFGKRSTVGQA